MSDRYVVLYRTNGKSVRAELASSQQIASVLASYWLALSDTNTVFIHPEGGY